jgi:hypothetical protein
MAAGACTVTAHQAGNDDFTPAEDVSQSFAIAKAPATITVGTTFTFNGTVQSASITTSPSGLSGVTVTYSQGGSLVPAPINAGTYDVSATLDNQNYQAPQAIGTLIINPALPTILWTPASLTAGTPLGSTHLNATATGLGGVALSGSWTYTPPAGTVFVSGPTTLLVDFTPSSTNYASASQTVSITVASGINFTGFFAPIGNMPAVNTVRAGGTIPIKFALAGYRGSQVLQVGSPTSVPMKCGAGAAEIAVSPVTTSMTGLHSVANIYTYVWKTDPNWAGSCRKFILTLVDGSTHEALVRFAPSAAAQGRKAFAR